MHKGVPSAASGRGVGPSALGPLLRDRSVRLSVGLAVAVAIPVAVLFYFQFRSLSALGQSSAVVLRQLSKETADGVTKNVQDSLKAPYLKVLLGIPQQRTEPLDIPFISNAVEQSLAASPFVERFFIWSDVASETRYRDQVLAYDWNSHAFKPAGVEGADMLQRVRDLAPEKRAIEAFETTTNGRRKYVQVQVRYVYPSRDRLTSFVALTVDVDRFRNEYFATVLMPRLTASDNLTAFPPLVVTVIDQNNRVVSPPGGSASMPYVDERTFPIVFFEPELAGYAAPGDRKPEVWRIRTGYGAQTIPEIIEARARPQRAMMAVLAGVMALGVFFFSRATAREVRLAELKSNFVASVSHDLKTPLALIQLFAETLELGRLKSTDRAQEYYRIINSEARKLTRLINNILDFSRIEAGLRRYKAEPADLAETTQRVLDSLDSQFRQNQFTVTFRAQAKLPPVLMDTEAAEQAIENLLSNAMKYSPENRNILVEVDAADGFGRVRVVDQGIGIPTRLQRKIFRKFYRVESDAGSGPQGCGLGLAIVDSVMRAQGGFVRVDSDPGHGSTFTLHFPIYVEAPGEQTHSGDRGRTADVARSA